METLKRAVVCGSVSASGAVVVGLMAAHAVAHPLPLVGLLLAGFGGLIGLALLVAGAVLYRSDVTTPRAARVAGWNALGIVVIGVAMVLFYTYQTAVDMPPPNPVFSGTVVVGVSAVAHVLIGVNDVRRIRASELAQERQKLSVLTRLVRHNLRTEAQLLYNYADQVENHETLDIDPPEVAADVRGAGDTFVEMYENIKLLQEVIDARPPSRPVDLAPLVAECVEEFRTSHPGATIETDLPEGQAVAAGGYLHDALEELVENALVHAGTDTPHVTVSATPDGDSCVVLSVRDDGPGVPDQDRRVVLDDRQVTQLDHASGLGLWLVRWIVDAYDGDLDIRRPDGGGTDVRLRLRAV